MKAGGRQADRYITWPELSCVTIQLLRLCYSMQRYMLLIYIHYKGNESFHTFVKIMIHEMFSSKTIIIINE